MKFKRHNIIILMIILSLSLFTISCTSEVGETKTEETKGEEASTLSRTEFLMDTVMTVKVYDHATEEIMDDVFFRIGEIEDKMSATLEDSDVSEINKNAGLEAVEVDPETYFVLEKAKEYAQMSDGFYDPTIGPLVELWDVKASEKERDNIPGEEDIKNAQVLIDYNDLELLDENKVFLKEKGMMINLSSIAKGYAADEVKEVLKQHSIESAIIDLGGNVFAYGEKEGDPWRIGIQDPQQVTGTKLATVNIKDRSIVSSGSYERYFMYEGKRYHHILNPKTGAPSENELLGVTIVSDTSIDGDALSTFIYVVGLEEGKRLISEFEGVEAIFVTEDQVHVPQRYEDEEIFIDLSPDYELKLY